MPQLCAFGCKPTVVPVHRFPSYEKFPERFKLWVTLCGGKLDATSDYECYKKKIVCDKHFTDKDRNRNKRLNALAVPSLFLSGIMACEDLPQNVTGMDDKHNHASLHELPPINAPAGDKEISDTAETADRSSQSLLHQHSLKGIMACEDFVQNVTGTADKHNHASLHELPTINAPAGDKEISNTTETAHRSSQSLLHQHSIKGLTSGLQKACVLDEHNYTAASRHKRLVSQCTGPRFNSAQFSNMRTQIKTLRSQICRLKKNKSFEASLANARKLTENMAFQQVVSRMSKPSQLFVNMQIQASKKPKGRRFTIEEKILAVSLYKKSPKCYALLHKYFTLPSAKAMKRLLGRIRLCPGINPIIFEKIKKSISDKDTTDRLCSLAFDEMSLTTQINYNAQKDCLEGFATNNDSQFADHALVFMVKGIKQNFKQPIAYYFTNCLNKIELKKLVKTVIRHAQDSGLIIVNTVCDQSTVNVSAINELVEEKKAKYLRLGKEWRYDCFSVKGRSIIPLFDTPHLIKGIRNNLLTKDLIYTTNNKEKTVKWEFFQRVYDADKSYGELKLLHKITEEHINPEKVNKMRVKTATQLFSHSVAVVAEHLTARGDLPEECRQLVDITVLLDNLFDSLNVCNLHVPHGKIYKGAVKKGSPHHKLWVEGKKVLKSAKYIKKKVSGSKIRLLETTVPSIRNFIKTIEGMEAIWQVLNKKFGLDAMLTRNFNQDPVENFFGNIRSYGARNNAPNTISFEGAFKALLLNNYSAPHSKRANCEEDNNECLENLDFFLREKYSIANDIPEQNIQYNENVCVDLNITEKDAGQINYVCGWVLTKCLKTVCKSCQQCRQTLLSNSTTRNNAFIRAKEYCNKSWLCYPSQDAENCFRDVQNITRSFLKKNVPKREVKKTIVTYCDLFIDYPFKCVTHKDMLKESFLKCSINVILYSWCRTINRILSGKIQYEGEDETKKSAAVYYSKHKHYKNRK